jgi:hypothetical protein
MIASCRAAQSPIRTTDALYLAVRRYVTDNAGQSPARILAAHAAAMPELARMIVRPTPKRFPSSPAKADPRISESRSSCR